MNATYIDFQQTAVNAGVGPEVAASLSRAFRDSESHFWTDHAAAWCGDADLLLARALDRPEGMAAVCDYYLSCDGGNYPDGLASLDEETRELAESIILDGWV